MKVPQSCPTLGDPIDHTVRGILQARILEWAAFPGDLPNPGIKPRSPALQADSLPAELQEKPKNNLRETRHQRRGCVPTLPELSISIWGKMNKVIRAHCTRQPQRPGVCPENHLEWGGGKMTVVPHKNDQSQGGVLRSKAPGNGDDAWPQWVSWIILESIYYKNYRIILSSFRARWCS